MALEPASGYGGLYIQVSGDQWPQNMMVLVTLEDAQGRSETLAASDTDQAGHLATGFLFPIDQRWLNSESLWVVTTTADGRVESKAQFTLVPPGAEVATTSTGTTASDVAAVEEGNAVTETVTKSTVAKSTVTKSTVTMNEEAKHRVVLPLVSSAGVERSQNRRASRSSSSRANSSGVTQVDIEIDPNGSRSIDCRNGQEWITVAIYSRGGFDATAVDPGSVVVSGASSDLGDGGSPANALVAFKESSKQGPVQRERRAYQWTWHLDDVDGDGSTDMVLEFRLDYTELACDAAVAAVRGRTKDGKEFEGTNRVDMLVLERG
jgi:hypothetical protein